LSGSVMITDGGRLCVQPSSYCPDHLWYSPSSLLSKPTSSDIIT
jgi:hypothetical protein